MDIWAWFGDTLDTIAETDRGLAYRLSSLPSWVLDGRHEHVDAVVPELLAAAKRLESPWLEVFVRHWRLQSWVFQRHDISRGMPESFSGPLTPGLTRANLPQYGSSRMPSFQQRKLLC